MSDFNRNYYLRRAEEEFDAADCAGSETAAVAHRILGKRYRALAHVLDGSEATAADSSGVRTL